MIPSLYDVKDFKIFAVIKVDDGYDIIALPQPLSIQYETNYSKLHKEYVIEWVQDVSKALYSDRSNFLIVYKYNRFDKKIDTEVLHVFSFDYSTCCCTDISKLVTYRYRCAVNFVLTPDEEMVVSKMNDRFRNKVNKLRGNNIDTIIIDELPNESDNMSDTFVVLRHAPCGISIVAMPTIADIYYNAPYTTVKWSDGTATTVAATNGEEFNKELGLAMAMSRKYCECMGLKYPRAGFKRMVNNAHDQTAKTAARREYKKSRKLLKAASTDKDSNGHDSNI